MKIFYVTMFFPAPTEPFAAGDIRALREMAGDVSVHSLRRSFPGSEKLLEERGLGGLVVSHGGWQSFIRGLLISCLHPRAFSLLLLWLLRVALPKPTHLLKGLVLIPRAMEVFALILRERPDVVHLFWGHYPSLVGFLVQRFCPSTVLSIFLGAYDLWTGFGGSADVARNAHVVWTHAGCNVPAILGWGVPREKINVCHRGIDRAPAGASHQVKMRRRVVTAGRLKATKGMDRVLRVFATTVRRWPDATLVVLGRGPEENNLKALARELNIEKSVFFRGHVPHEEVFREMDAAEVFILMTRHVAERLPNVVKEAMACRCLCLVSSTPGIEELVIDGETGFILPLEEADFAQKMEEIFAHPDRYAAMIDAGETFVREKFDARCQMAKYYQTWECLLSRRLISSAETLGRS